MLAEVHYENVHAQATNVNFPFAENDTSRTIVPAIATLMTESILETMDLVDQDALQQAAQWINDAEAIVVYAQSPNLYQALSFQRKMLTIGKKVIVPEHDTGLITSSLNEKNVALIISYSGNNPERYPLNVLNTLKENKVKTIGMTGIGNSVLRNGADLVLDMASRERLYTKIGIFASEESITVLLNSLFALVFAQHYSSIWNIKSNMRNVSKSVLRPIWT